jgi:hypothetical protein
VSVSGVSTTRPGSTKISNQLNSEDIKSVGLKFKVKSRLVWYSWMKYSGNYSSYQDFVNSLDNNVSLRKIIKNGFNKSNRE